jgi:hypothetical protein
MGSQVVIDEFLRLLVFSLNFIVKDWKFGLPYLNCEILASQCLWCLCWVWLNLEPKWFLTYKVIMIEENNTMIEDNDLLKKTKLFDVT